MSAAFCPPSNLFLGSGLFDRARLSQAGVRIALATDVGGGTSYSMLHTAAEGYKVLMLHHTTRGRGARAGALYAALGAAEYQRLYIWRIGADG